MRPTESEKEIQRLKYLLEKEKRTKFRKIKRLYKRLDSREKQRKADRQYKDWEDEY
jgi:hypothetical protein